MFRSQKPSNTGISRFWKTKSEATSQTSGKDQTSGFKPSYLRLEQRTLLSATFATLGTTELVLNDFDAGQDLDFSQRIAVVNGVVQETFSFQVSSGSFTGNTADPLIELESINGGINNRLEIAAAFFQGSSANADFTIDGLSATGTTVEFTQSSSILTFDTLQLSNFSNDNRDLDLVAIGDVTLNNVTIFDSNPADAVTAPATLDATVIGDLNLAGQTGNLISNPNANVALLASGNISMTAGAELTSQQAIDLTSANGSVILSDVSAGADVQVQAASNITQQANTTINAGTNVNLTATSGTATLANVIAGDDVLVQTASDITQQTGTTIDAATTVDFTANNGAITLADISTGDALQIQAANDVTQRTNSAISAGTSATVVSNSGDILLAATPDRTITVQDQASFIAGDRIEIGLDGEAAGSVTATNVRLGSVTLNSSEAVLVEDDTTTLTGDSDVDDLFLSSGQSINNAAGASLTSNNAQLNAASDIVMGNQVGDSFTLGEVSVIAANAHLEVDTDLVINGVQPTAANTTPIPTGTLVSQSWFVVAEGSVEQTQGDLHAQQIGIEASEHVHLTSVDAVNDAIAITAGGSQLLTDPTLIATLDSLAAVENGEVDASRPQSISLAHRGDVNVTNVTSVTGSDSLTGFNSTDSISVFADQTISLQRDITAFSVLADPQITLWSATGDGNNPGVFFDGGQASVTGPTNFGVVNANQVFANYLDTDGFLFEGTTQVLTLNSDGTASQDVVVEYGSLGEAGYRIGVVWDSLNQVGSPIENINLFTPSNTVASEAYEDVLYQQNTVTRAIIGGNEGGRETITKIEDFTAQAVINHSDDPNVFADITIRNDQDINLFSGTLASVTNTLNENQRRILQAVFDAPKGAVLELPEINMINSIEVKKTFDLPFDSPPPLDQTSSIFSRQIAPFEDGELRWVHVEIPVDEMEMIGDEISLKQPSKLYPAVEDAVEQAFQNVGENENDRIIEEIERSPNAEPGYWYRIFKAYDYRGDELFFYYYKTGEVDDAGSEPETGDNESLDEERFNEQESSPEGKASANDFSNRSTPHSETTTARNPVTDDELLIGLLRREAGATGATTELHADFDEPTVDQAVFAESYDQWSRLKRKLKRYL